MRDLEIFKNSHASNVPRNLIKKRKGERGRKNLEEWFGRNGKYETIRKEVIWPEMRAVESLA